MGDYVIQEIASLLNLDSTTRTKALQYFNQFKDKDSAWNDEKSDVVIRATVLVASKAVQVQTIEGTPMKESSISLSSILRGLSKSEMQTFMKTLKQTLILCDIESGAKSEVKIIIESYAFSAAFYKKYDTLWDRIKLAGNLEILANIRQLGWMLFILIKAEFHSTEIATNACNLVAVFNFLVTQRPSNVAYDIEDSSLESLTLAMNADSTQTTEAVETVTQFVARLKGQGVLRGTHEDPKQFNGLLQANHILHNINSLNVLYQQKINMSDIDERDFITHAQLGTPVTPIKNRMMLTPFAKQGEYKKLSSSRLLHYEDQSVAMTDNLSDIKSRKPTNLQVNMTPMTMAMEMNKWLLKHTSSHNSYIMGLPSKLYEQVDKFEENLAHEIIERTADISARLTTVLERYGIGVNSLSSSMIRANFSSFGDELGATDQIPTTPKRNKKVEEIINFYYTVLSALIINEEQKLRASNLSIVLHNDSFHRSIMACCVETVFFVHNITYTTFEEKLDIWEISAFEFWKLINSFAQFDLTMPVPIKRHFKSIENRIICCTAWQNSSVILNVIKKMIRKDKASSHPSHDLFFKRVLTMTAHKIMELCDRLGLQEVNKEYIWTSMKHVLSEKTEMLTNRHLDQLILCTIYGVCKTQQLSISFNNIITVYSELYQEDEVVEVIARIPGENDESVDIIKFYNSVYIGQMKKYLFSMATQTEPVEPRIAVLAPQSPLRANLAPLVQISGEGPKVNATPRTRRLFAFGESPIQALRGINKMISSASASSRRLTFGDEQAETEDSTQKKPKHMRQIFDQPSPTFHGLKFKNEESN